MKTHGLYLPKCYKNTEREGRDVLGAQVLGARFSLSFFVSVCGGCSGVGGRQHG
jgi:hypothetical protein